MRALALVLTALALQGCATVDRRSAEQTEAAPERRIKFQHAMLDPREGGRLMAVDELLPGDILLSASVSALSVAVRVATTSPVSHAALYVGEGEVAEAVGSGVRLRPIEKMLDEEIVVVAFRHPAMHGEQREDLRKFALQKVGGRYDLSGAVLHGAFSLPRRLCDLPFVSESLRESCLSGAAGAQAGTARNDRFFCSQFVLEAYRQAGLPLTDAEPRWISPADIMHMRENDVPSIRAHQPLVYVGHLKDRPFPERIDVP